MAAMVACSGGGAPDRTTSARASGSLAYGRFSIAPGSQNGQWLTAAGDHASTRYSALDEINTSNVSRLRVAWTFSTGVTAGHEAAPLVIDDTMYLVSPFPNFVYALDLTKPGAPIKWQYDPKPPSELSAGTFWSFAREFSPFMRKGRRRESR
jgi:lanthanide-dependent methanol dehydrogenase